MKMFEINAKFKDITLPEIKQNNSSVVITSIKGIPLFKYGVHAYYFLNFSTKKGILVTVNHKDIVSPGFKRFLKVNSKIYKNHSFIKFLFRRYHFNFTLLEQFMLMTVPHSCTYIGNGRYFINLWSYFGYLDIDIKNRIVKYRIIDEEEDDSVLGSQQYYDVDNDELYYTLYSLEDSLRRIKDPYHLVCCRLLKQNNKTGKTEELWKDSFVDYLHDLLINKTKQYCVIPELGMYHDLKKELILSKALVYDLKNQRQWIISDFKVAAHAQFDPNDPNTIYFSNHNFQFEHSNIFKLLKNASYSIKYYGTALISKYKLSKNGPEKVGEFTHPDFFRLTNFHVFIHRKQKIIAAIGFPNYIFIVDAENMTFIKKISVQHINKKIPCGIGSISPSPDGEKIFVQTTRSCLLVDIVEDTSTTILDHDYNHSCANHMIISPDINW